MNKTFVLIHGTWHGGWAWKEVIGQLSTKGQRAYAPTLAGHGPGATRVGITHRDCVASVVTYIEEHQLQDVVLVGHSFGGTVVQKVVEELPGRIARTVFLDALILKDNQCVFDLLPDVFLEALKPKNGSHPAAAGSEEAVHTLAPAPWETWRDNFMQDAVEEHAWLMGAAYARACPGQPGRPGSETVLYTRHPQELHLLPPGPGDAAGVLSSWNVVASWSMQSR